MIHSTLPDDIKELAAGYVLDELEPEELVIFEQMMLNNAAVRQEVRELQMLLGGLAVDVPQLTPPAHLRTKTLAALGIAEEVPAVSAASAQVTQNTPRKTINWSKVTAIVSLITAAAFAWENFNLRQDLSFAQQQTPESVASLLQRPNSKLVSLTSPTTPDASGTLLFTPGKWQEVVVSAQNLPPLPADQVYRLWLNLNNQQVIYCGEFQTNPEGNISRSIQPPQVPPPGTKATGLFVTAEQKAAAIAPTGVRVMSGTI
ncbi:MAG: anti-sigma factor [Thermosynechococcaceae cyanobacterium MS004]|nr:anti-sigma factor [Thermosynechococcaceae cyanobacterium MS004]